MNITRNALVLLPRRGATRWVAGGIRVASLLWLVGHFALTVAYVMPLNPLKVYLKRLLDVTIGTFYPQNWNLFAPNPLSSNEMLLVRPLTSVEVRSMKAKREPRTGWYDVSTPVWIRFQQHRFTAYDRLSRAQLAGIRTYLSGLPDGQVWVEACRKGDSTSCRVVEGAITRERAQAIHLLVKIASAFCRDLGLRGKHYTYVGLRVRQQLPVPWSARYTGKPIVHDIALGAYPIDTTVPAPGLWVATESR